MFLSEQQDRELRSALVVTRILAFAMCYGGPAVCALVYAVAVLEGRWGLFLQGPGTVPWQNPLVLGLLAASAITLAGAFVLPGVLTLNPQRNNLPPLTVLRTRCIVGFAMLEAVAIYGLVLGFVLGTAVATLTLALLLVPPILCPFVLPGETQWREWCDDRNKDGHA